MGITREIGSYSEMNRPLPASPELLEDIRQMYASGMPPGQPNY
jgi:hypothetical protein